MKRAATFRVLTHLWRFADNEKSEVWCYRTDAEVIESCNLGGERQLRRCLSDLREARLIERENAPDGRLGFRLFNRKPHVPDAGQKCPDRSVRTKVSVPADRSDRPAGQKWPRHLLESRRAETVDSPAFTLEPETKTPKPRKPRSKTKLSDGDAERLFAAQQAARAQVARRIGKSIGPASLLPGLRKAMDKAFALYPDVDGLCGAMAYRGKTDKTAEQLRWLSGASAWSEKPIGIAYANRIDIADMAPEMKVDENGWGEEPR